MNTIPTAESILSKHSKSYGAIENNSRALVKASEANEAMIEFAKLHVQAALEAANKNKKIELFVRPDKKGAKYKKVESGENYDIFGTRQMWKVNKESILNAYPTTNIK